MTTPTLGPRVRSAEIMRYPDAAKGGFPFVGHWHRGSLSHESQLYQRRHCPANSNGAGQVAGARRHSQAPGLASTREGVGFTEAAWGGRGQTGLGPPGAHDAPTPFPPAPWAHERIRGWRAGRADGAADTAARTAGRPNGAAGTRNGATGTTDGSAGAGLGTACAALETACAGLKTA